MAESPASIVPAGTIREKMVEQEDNKRASQRVLMTAVIEHRARVDRSCGVLDGLLASTVCRKGHPMRNHA